MTSVLTSTTVSVPYTPPWYPDIAAAAPARYEEKMARLRKQLEKTKDQAAFDAAALKAEQARQVAEILPVFKLRAAGVIERGMMEAELSGYYRAHTVQGFELKQAMREGVQALIPGDPELDGLLALIESQGDEDVEFDEAETKQLLGVQSALAEHWPPFRELIAQMERRRQMVPIVALRRYCVGWENCRNNEGQVAVFARGHDGLVTEAALAGLAPLDMSAAGNEAYSLQYVTERTEGNLPQPSQSDDGRATSGSGVTSKAGGRSAKPSGKKTRG